ncbi:ANTAR domain-containing response regulator [Pseudonocardia sp.]|jgi:hypothetical protein|uniref:ANTAR domain-containing response regulator n=1 Tax=Pseudonocardia sp. TaxID=60912 RepID=UPI003D12A6B8
MPDDLDLSRPIEALSRSRVADHVGRFRLDLSTGACSWPVAPTGPARDVDPVALLTARDDGSMPLLDVATTGTPAAAVFRTGADATARTLLVVVEPEPEPVDGSSTAVAGTVVDLGPAPRNGAPTDEDLRARIDQLESALRSRPVIEQAKGMLMQNHRCTEDVAFRLLIGISQAVNRKLRDIAAELVDSLSAGRPIPEDTARALATERMQAARRDGDAAPRR